MKQLIFFALAVLTFAASILYSSQFLDIKPLEIMLALGVLLTSFLHMAGLNKRDFDEMKYKKLLREKNNQIKTLLVMNKISNDNYNQMPIDHFLSP